MAEALRQAVCPLCGSRFDTGLWTERTPCAVCGVAVCRRCCARVRDTRDTASTAQLVCEQCLKDDLD